MSLSKDETGVKLKFIIIITKIAGDVVSVREFDGSFARKIGPYMHISE